MKKLLVLACAFLVAAGLSAEGLKVGFGADVSYLPGVLENQTVTTSGLEAENDYSYSAMAARAFVDFTYGIVSVGYRASTSDLTTKGKLEGIDVGSTKDTLDAALVEVRALVKYPINVGFCTLTPMGGLEYTSVLVLKIDGVDMDSTTKNDWSDFCILGGVGAEFDAGQLFIRPSFTVGFNLTSKRNSDYYSGVDYKSSSGFEYEVAVSIGYWL